MSAVVPFPSPSVKSSCSFIRDRRHQSHSICTALCLFNDAQIMSAVKPWSSREDGCCPPAPMPHRTVSSFWFRHAFKNWSFLELILLSRTWWVACEKCDQILLGSNVDLFFVCEKKTTKKKRDTIEKKKKKKEKERLCCSREEEETLECCTWYWYKRCRCFVVLFILHLKYIFLKLYYQILVLSLMSINTILLLLFAL